MANDKSKKRPSGEIWVNEFNEDAAQEFRQEVMELSTADKTKPIVVYIDSYGGMVDSLAKMIETMDEVPNPIVTVAVGKAMSCGAVLLSHGDVRLCGPHSRIMVHEVSSGAGGDVHDLYADAVETKRLNRWFMGLLARNCNIPGGYEAIRKLIKNQDGRNKYMDAGQAVKFGLVDAIGMPSIDEMTLYQINVVSAKKRFDKVKLDKNPDAKNLPEAIKCQKTKTKRARTPFKKSSKKS